MKILSILLVLLIAYTSNIQGKNNGNSNKNNGNSNKNNGNSNKNNGNSNKNNGNSNKNNGNSNKNNGNSNKNNGGSSNGLCCEEAGQQAGLFCRCRQACAGNPCNAGQGIGFGGGKYCGNGVCCCGTGCKKSIQSDTCKPTTNTKQPTTAQPTTTKPTTSQPTTVEPTTSEPTTSDPTTHAPTTAEPTTAEPTTSEPTTHAPTTAEPTTTEPTTHAPTTSEPTTSEPTTSEPTTAEPTTAEPTTSEPTTRAPTTSEPTTSEPTTHAPTTSEPTTSEPTTAEPTTSEPTTRAPTTVEPTTSEPTTHAPTPSIPESECVTNNPLNVTATYWKPVSHPYTPHYFTNCVLVALDGAVDWIDELPTNRMGTSDETITTLTHSDDGPFFDQVFSVTNDFGSDNVIRVTSYDSEPSTIILESWSLPIIAYYSTKHNNMYYIDQDNTNTIPNTPSGQVIKKNDGTTETIDWTQLSTVTFDGIVWLSEKSKLDEVPGTQRVTKTLGETNKLQLNERETNENAFMTEGAYSKDSSSDFITSPVGILVLVIVGVLIIVIFCFIGMRCMDKIKEKRNATVHFEP